jgi:hypothetical protein
MKKLSKTHRLVKPKPSTVRRKRRQFRAFLRVTKYDPGTSRKELVLAFDRMWPQLPLLAKQQAVQTYGGPL